MLHNITQNTTCFNLKAIPKLKSGFPIYHTKYDTRFLFILFYFPFCQTETDHDGQLTLFFLFLLSSYLSNDSSNQKKKSWFFFSNREWFPVFNFTNRSPSLIFYLLDFLWHNKKKVDSNGFKFNTEYSIRHGIW